MHLAGLGVTMGAHRLWAHKAYSARLPLRILLCTMFTIAGQNDLMTWVRDHRVSRLCSQGVILFNLSID